jgi:hypothetical protein
MKRALIFIFLLASFSLGHAGEPKAPENKETPASSRRYKIGDVKTPYDPLSTSIESSSPSFLSVVLTLGLIYFYRHGSISYGDRNAHISIHN